MNELTEQLLDGIKKAQERLGSPPEYEAFLMSAEDEQAIREKVDEAKPPEFKGTCLSALSGVQIFTHKYMTKGSALGGTLKQIKKILEYLDRCPDADHARLLITIFREVGVDEQEDGTLKAREGESFTVNTKHNG